MGSTEMAADQCNNLKRAALRGEWDIITDFYNWPLQRYILSNDVIPVTLNTGDTLLHMCAQCGRTDVMKELLRVMPQNVLRAKNVQGNTALHEAVRTGIVEMAAVILEKEEGLLSNRNMHGETPLYWAAMYGRKEMLLFLLTRYYTNNTTSTSSMDVRRNDGSTILHAAVVGEFYDLAIEILEVELYSFLVWSRNEEGATASHILALSPSSFKSGSIYSSQYVGASPFFSPEKNSIAIYAVIPLKDYKTVAARQSRQQLSFVERFKQVVKSGIQWICRGCPVLKSIYKAKEKHTYIMQLTKLLLKKDSQTQWGYASDGRDPRKDNNYTKRQYKGLNTTNKFEERPLVLATKMGIIEMVKEISEIFPESLEFVDEESGKNVLHLTAEYRHEYIMEWLRSMKKSDLANLVVGIDREGNTPLHFAAKLGESKPWHIRGAMHHMQWECIWFERIKYLLPAHMLTITNSNKQTAKEIFTETHKKLLENGEKWLKDVSNTCMLISTLLGTVMFASALTVPGGNDDKTGLPILLHTFGFTPFIQYAGVSLFFSLFSLGIFLSIHTSRFEEEDFYIWLPLKTIVALTMLFDSFCFTVASFSQAYFLVNGLKLSLVMTIVDMAMGMIGFFVYVYLYLDIIMCFLRYLLDIVFM